IDMIEVVVRIGQMPHVGYHHARHESPSLLTAAVLASNSTDYAYRLSNWWNFILSVKGVQHAVVGTHVHHSDPAGLRKGERAITRVGITEGGRGDIGWLGFQRIPQHGFAMTIYPVIDSADQVGFVGIVAM